MGCSAQAAGAGMAGRLRGSICRDRGIARMAAGGCRDVAGWDWRRGIPRSLPLQLGPVAGGCGRCCCLRRATLTGPRAPTLLGGSFGVSLPRLTRTVAHRRLAAAPLRIARQIVEDLEPW